MASSPPQTSWRNFNAVGMQMFWESSLVPEPYANNSSNSVFGERELWRAEKASAGVDAGIKPQDVGRSVRM